MVIAVVIGAVFLWFCLVELVKQIHHNATERWEARMYAEYRVAEDAYHHRRLLEEIEMARQATAEELSSAAHQARGEIVAGEAVETEARS